MPARAYRIFKKKLVTMFLQEPAHHPNDLELKVLGFPVRVSWTFWAAAAVIGYRLANQLDIAFEEQSPGLIVLLAIWGACIFVSITIHELGHALAFRKFGIESRIVLYFMGGMAIPTRSSGFRDGLTPKQAMWVSIAGPIAQIASAIVFILLLAAASYAAPIPWPLDQLEPIRRLAAGKLIDSPALSAMAFMYIQPSIHWALLNLIPVWPLDGGRFIHSLIQLNGGSIVTTLKLGVVTAGLMAFLAFSSEMTFLLFMFLILGWNNFQAVQQLQQSR